MVGIDTNILVRFLTADDKNQYQLALNYIQNQAEIFVTKTVMLELEWVLRAAYKIPKSQLADVFSDLIQMEHLIFEDEENLKQVIDLYKIGIDFADALHAVSSVNCTEFVTFDRKFAMKANDFSTISIRELI